MTAETKKANANAQFGLTVAQKITSGVILLALSTLVVPLNPLFNQPGWGMAFFVLYGLVLGVVTWYISAGWSFKLEITAGEIKVRDGHREVLVPMDKLGMVVKNGRLPVLPSLWLVLRGVENVGREIPKKGVDPRTRELIEAFQKRNPGKKITYVPVPGGYVRSIPEFIAELKRRIPPLTIDERLGGK
ncbi:MAG: hypothetical protein ACOY93_22740 [Bacillota bacterium]